jgi:hypothetical protein
MRRSTARRQDLRHCCDQAAAARAAGVGYEWHSMPRSTAAHGLVSRRGPGRSARPADASWLSGTWAVLPSSWTPRSQCPRRGASRALPGRRRERAPRERTGDRGSQLLAWRRGPQRSRRSDDHSSETLPARVNFRFKDPADLDEGHGCHPPGVVSGACQPFPRPGCSRMKEQHAADAPRVTIPRDSHGLRDQRREVPRLVGGAVPQRTA